MLSMNVRISYKRHILYLKFNITYNYCYDNLFRLDFLSFGTIRVIQIDPETEKSKTHLWKSIHSNFYLDFVINRELPPWLDFKKLTVLVILDCIHSLAHCTSMPRNNYPGDMKYSESSWQYVKPFRRKLWNLSEFKVQINILHYVGVKQANTDVYIRSFKIITTNYALQHREGKTFVKHFNITTSAFSFLYHSLQRTIQKIN